MSMIFNVGQIVELVDNSGMVAELGATAVVTKSNYNYTDYYSLIEVVWKTNFGCQVNGAYFVHYFKPYFRNGEQLLFSFMNE